MSVIVDLLTVPSIGYLAVGPGGYQGLSSDDPYPTEERDLYPAVQILEAVSVNSSYLLPVRIVSRQDF